ncbi:hypothetical protein OBRU01_21835 [Operophtera brumata]|uniref:Rhodanese domain-containing protein n=1 Tax=Operophtera brumata TaxID=104452 RepID=A0A0L7KSW0_OPEBR|nr:hypothetical protein OBRU01_21835 [Operophtera brumata]
MVDPKRVLSYEDMLKLIHQPEKVIIDVRNPDEVTSTGKIPSMGHVQDVLVSMSDADFKKQYQREKPSSSDESKTYLGSWNDWSNRQK